MSIRRIVRSFAFQVTSIAGAGILFGLGLGYGIANVTTYGDASTANAGVFINLPADHWCGYEWRGDPAADLAEGDHFVIRIDSFFCDVD